jgi:hypothetical protein
LCKLICASGKIDEIGVQLLEPEAEREDAFQIVG